MKHFLSIESLGPSEIESLVDNAYHQKQNRRRMDERVLLGQTWALVFLKSSTRTRVSFEVGVHELGGHTLFLSGRDLQLGRGEPIQDTARVLGRMVDGAIIRNDSQDDLEAFAKFANIPTVNALTDLEHPCQVIADLLTLRERREDWKDLHICFIGDGTCNMARSWIWAAGKLGLHLTIAAPEAFQPQGDWVTAAGGLNLRIESDPLKAVENSHVLYTDVWVSMGREDEADARRRLMAPYQVNHDLLEAAAPDAMVMHCLPAYRGMEITEDILEEHASLIFDQAENRLHAQKAIMSYAVS